MDWREDYKRKLTSHEDAVKAVKSGDLVVLPLAGPAALGRALAQRKDELENVTVRLCSPPGDLGWYGEDAVRAFEIEFVLFIGDANRQATDSLRATYLPNVFSVEFKGPDERPDEVGAPDVALINVSEPNGAGYVNLGVNMWHKKAYARRARRVIAEITPGQAIAHGDCWMHVSEIDAFVEGQPFGGFGAGAAGGSPMFRALAAVPEGQRDAFRQVLLQAERTRLQALLPEIMPRLTEYTPEALAQALGVTLGAPDWARTIAGHVSELVKDGATIQVGVGDPARWMVQLGAFDGKHDLGIHTELACPGLARLWERGIVTGARRTIHRGVCTAVAWTGSDNEDMKIIDDNPRFQLYDPEYILNLRTVMSNSDMIAINNAVSIDLLGQINSESVFGGRMVNGTGGQPEMHIGAFSAPGGRAVTLLQATALGGSVSRIVAQHEAGSLVTIPRFFADTVVTEYGIARLAGKNHRQRAAELIAIAHPDFRGELRREAQRMLGKV